MFTLVEDADYQRPPTDPELPVEYAEHVGVDRAFPLGVDLAGAVETAIPEAYGGAIPGKCIVTPDMKLLTCWESAGLEEGIEAMRADWDARR